MCLGRIGVVTKVWEERGVPMALVDDGSTLATACLMACPEIDEGTSVLVHLGYVVEVLEPAAARDAQRLRAGITRVEEEA